MCCLLLESVCCLLCSGCVGIFVLYVILVVGGVLLWVFSRVDVMCCCLLCTQLQF